jgi:hypothetical protein
MQTSIFALVVVDVHFDFLGQTELGAVGKFQVFGVGGKNIVGFAGGNVLSELTHVIGVLFPSDFFRLVGSTAYFHANAVDGAIVGSPNRAEDDCIGLPRFLRSGIQDSWGETKEDEADRQWMGQSQIAQTSAEPTNSHRPRFLVPLLLPLRSPPRRLSIRAGWW